MGASGFISFMVIVKFGIQLQKLQIGNHRYLYLSSQLCLQCMGLYGCNSDPFSLGWGKRYICSSIAFMLSSSNWKIFKGDDFRRLISQSNNKYEIEHEIDYAIDWCHSFRYKMTKKQYKIHLSSLVTHCLLTQIRELIDRQHCNGIMMLSVDKCPYPRKQIIGAFNIITIWNFVGSFKLLIFVTFENTRGFKRIHMSLCAVWLYSCHKIYLLRIPYWRHSINTAGDISSSSLKERNENVTLLFGSWPLLLDLKKDARPE